MDKQLRIRNTSVDLELALWKILPVLFTILLVLISTSLGAGAEGGSAPPMSE
ncbi:MAG: hypothetical protein ACTSPV_09835 [Candidatus Hodarchaeales archaeon]